MTFVLTLLAVIAFAVAAIVCFVGSVAITTILAIIAIGLALFAAAAITPNVP